MLSCGLFVFGNVVGRFCLDFRRTKEGKLHVQADSSLKIFLGIFLSFPSFFQDQNQASMLLVLDNFLTLFFYCSGLVSFFIIFFLMIWTHDHENKRKRINSY